MCVWREFYCCGNIKKANAKISNKGLIKISTRGKHYIIISPLRGTLNFHTYLWKNITNVGWRKWSSARTNECLHPSHFGPCPPPLGSPPLIIIWYIQMGMKNKVGNRITFATNHHHHQYPWACNALFKFPISNKKWPRIGLIDLNDIRTREIGKNNLTSFLCNFDRLIAWVIWLH